MDSLLDCLARCDVFEMVRVCFQNDVFLAPIVGASCTLRSRWAWWWSDTVAMYRVLLDIDSVEREDVFFAMVTDRELEEDAECVWQCCLVRSTS
jgi:hypothetical protein